MVYAILFFMNRNRVFGSFCLFLSMGLTAVYFTTPTTRLPSLIWLPIMLLLALGITFLLQLFMNLQREPALSLSVLDDEMDRTQALNVAIGMMMLALVLFVSGRIFWRWEEGGQFSIVGTAVLTFLLLASLGIGFYSLRKLLFVRDKDYAPIRQLLDEHPERIVWVYDLSSENLLETAMVESTQAALSQPTESTLYIWLQDNTQHQITIPREEVDSLLILISERSPQAHIGYDEALAQRYHS